MSLNIDMTDSFACRLMPLTVYDISYTYVDAIKTPVEVSRSENIAVQMAEPEDLKIDQIDTSKQYIWAFCFNELKINEEVEWSGIRFKVIKLYNATLYGYWKAICEEVKA